MSKNKRKKQRLKTALILLIIFVYSGRTWRDAAGFPQK